GTFCVNGFCSSLCPIDQDVCPEPQECVEISEPEEGEEAPPGICTILGDDADHPCPDGQLCLMGFCATPCASDDDCGDDDECSEFAPGLSVCVPSDSGGGGGFP